MAHEEGGHPYIKHVLLQNFMCHQNFEINLGKRLNLIYGTNGSGKSTVLTALMVALGSRAKNTSRSESLGSLVKSGTTRAWIHVKFHIPPEYRELYTKFGDEVTVTRVIGVKGDSQYQVRDSNGRKLPKGGVSDVRLICYHFGIYPDNELAMLSQENAKEFLVHATGHVKYEKLQRAMLHHIITKNQQAVAAAEAEHQSLVAQMRQREQNIEILEQRSQEVLNRASEQINRKQRMKLIKNIVEWREVDKVAQQLEDVQVELAKEQEELHTLESTEINADEQDILNSKIEELQNDVVSINRERDTITDAITASENESQDLRYTVSRCKEDVNLYREEIAQFSREISALEDKAANNSPEILARRRKTHEEKREFAVERKNQTSDRRAELEQRVQELESSKESHRHHLNVLMSERGDLQSNLQLLRDELKQLSSGESKGYRKNPLHDKHKQLQNLVSKQSNWKAVPVGPLYENLEMNDEGSSYSPALERLWNHTLDCWWVQTEADRTKLERLAESLRFHSLHIILRKDDKFSFNSALPPVSGNYKRAIDLLNIESDAIKRILVDLNHIEAMVMVHGTQSAFSAVKADKRIRNALALTTTQQGKTHFSQISVTSTRTDSATVRPHDLVRIKVGTKARRNQINSEIDEINTQMDSLNERITVEKQEIQDITSKLEEEKRNIIKLTNVERKFEDEIADAAREIMIIDTDVGVQDYSDDISRIKGLIERRQRDLDDNTTALTEFESSLREAELLINAKETERQNLSTSLSSSKNKLKELEKKRQSREAEMMQRDRRMNRKRVRIETLEGQVRASESLVADVTESTEEAVGARVHGDNTDDETDMLLRMSTDLLQAELRKLRTEAQVVVASDREIEKAQEEASNAAEARVHVEQNRREMEELSQIIEYRRKVRQENEKRAWNSVKARIETAFSRTLQRRKFTGRVTINDEKKKLAIEAAPESSSSHSVSTLSGGEKSFTQVALLMSVWEAMQVGLVAMDEYDVFMDKANRSMSLRLLAETISRHEMQCILITPQDVDTSALQGIEFTMHKLNPARRN